MKFIIAPDSFKGSLSSMEIIELATRTLKYNFPEAEIVGIPIADGGEGTIDALVHALKGQRIYHEVSGPLGRPVKAYYGQVGDTAIIEMANCSGLPLLAPHERNPLETSSYGTGQMLMKVIQNGFKKIIIGLGGSATNDGGTGMLEALGVKFVDINHRVIDNMCGRKLEEIEYIDASDLLICPEDLDIQIMCDVDNPLTGPHGATAVYGPQKGADPVMVDQLERGMVHYRNRLKDYFHEDVGAEKGTGAAGGLGVGIKAFLKGQLKSGIDVILEMGNFEDQLTGTGMVITGEGQIDHQSIQGKVIDGITRITKKYEIPVIVIAGGMIIDFEILSERGVSAVLTLPNRPMSLENTMMETRTLLVDQLYQMSQILKLGKTL